MKKLSTEKVAAVLAEVPLTLRKLAREKDHWRLRALEAEQCLKKQANKVRIEKLAEEIERRGLDTSRSRSDRIALLEKKAMDGKLEVIEEAVSMSPVARPFGEFCDSLGGTGANVFEEFLLDELK